jgi:aminopeptidase-like protein
MPAITLPKLNMNLNSSSYSIPDPQQVGAAMYHLIADLYPICRSITGDGVRKTLAILQELIPLEVHEVPTGTQVFDWVVPKEWNIHNAYVKNAQGEKVIDFQASNLHLLNYSVPIHQIMPLAQLQERLFTLPEHPEWIPYRTSYYQETWGFCLSHSQFQTLEEGDYEVYIDASLENGHLTYGECYLPGETLDEVLFSCHICHPSLCNDNLSGIALATFLAQHLRDLPRRYSYRFLFIPGTIGAITWLALNAKQTHRIKHGLVISGVGDPGAMTYKQSRQGDAEIDRVVSYVLQQSQQAYTIEAFSPYGYDERQYCSPGFNLPIGRLGRTPFGQYPEYHTSADNLEFVQPSALAAALQRYLEVIGVVENNRRYLSTNPYCEPQLGKRGLYSAVGGKQQTPLDQMALLWVLNLADGHHGLLDIAERSSIPFERIYTAANALCQSNLLQELCPSKT